MTWGVKDLEDARLDLTSEFKKRAQNLNLPPDVLVARSPVGMVFIRGDRAEPGATLAKQIVSSYAHWHDDSGQYFDLIFFGWAEEAKPPGEKDPRKDISFDHQAFQHCRDQVQAVSKWRYSGESDVLLLDFEVPLHEEAGFTDGRFIFLEAIPLQVEAMIRDKRCSSLDALFHQIIQVAKEEHERRPMQVGAWEISDRILYLRGSRSTWEALKKLVLRDFTQVYNELRDFTVCNLSIDPTEVA